MPRTFLLAVSILCLAPAVAGAATVMVSTPTGLTTKDAAAVEKRVKEALKKGGHKIATTGVSIEDSAAALGCSAEETECVARIAATAGVDYVVRSSAAPSDSGRLVVRLGVHRADGTAVGDTEVSVERASAPGDYATAIEPLLGVRSTTVATATPKGSAGDAVTGKGKGAGTGTGSGAGTSTGGTASTSGGGKRRAPGKILPLTWGVAGGGVVLLGVGIGLAAWASSLQAKLNREDLLGDPSRREARILFGKMRGVAAAAGAFIGAGSLAFLTGGFLLADNLWLGIVFAGDDGEDFGVSMSGRF